MSDETNASVMQSENQKTRLQPPGTVIDVWRLDVYQHYARPFEGQGLPSGSRIVHCTGQEMNRDEFPSLQGAMNGLQAIYAFEDAEWSIDLRPNDHACLV